MIFQKGVIQGNPFFDYLSSIMLFTLQLCLCMTEMMLDDPLKMV
jgi:hypothetical protein